MISSGVISEYVIAEIGTLNRLGGRARIVASVGERVRIGANAVLRVAVANEATATIAITSEAHERIGIQAMSADTTTIVLGVDDE